MGDTMRKGNIFEFPTGRRLCQSVGDGRSVAVLARKLSSGARLRTFGPIHDVLSIDISDLTGISDDTIDRLRALAAHRVLTPSSVVRLALRHASEIGRFRPWPPQAARPFRSNYDFILAGDVFESFACRIEDRLGGAWVARGTLEDRALLFEICPPDGCPLYIAHGMDADTGPRTFLRKPRNWRSDLSRMAEGAEGMRDWHVLIVGGLPTDGQKRATVIGGIADGLRRGGAGVRIVKAADRSEFDTEAGRLRDARSHLNLIEIAYPGLVDVPAG